MKKNYEIIQEEISDCGICCLASIIKYYNGFVPLETLRYYTNTSNIGTNAYEIINCAKKIGFNSCGKKILLDDINNYQLPLIAHIKFENGLYHFVVVYEIKKDYLMIMDPSQGFIKITNDKFKNIFTGVILLFYPVGTIPVYDNNKFINNKIINFIKNNILKYFIIIMISSISLFLLIIQTFEIKILSNNFKYFYLLMIVIILNELIVYLKNILLLKSNISFNNKIINNFVSHVFKLPLNYLKLKQKGEISTRFSELDNLSNNIINIMIDIIFNTVITLVLLILLLIFNNIIFVILFSITIIYLLLNYKIYKKILNKMKYYINLEESYNSNIVDYIGNFTTIKHLSLYDYFINNINNNLRDKNEVSFILNKKVYLISLFDNIIFGIIGLFTLLIITINKFNVINGIVLFSIINYYISVVRKITTYYPSIILFKNILVKNNDFLSIKLDKKEALNLENNIGISIDNLNFSINGYNIIRNLSVEFKNNEKIFLNGPSGVGKSSFLKILSNEIINYSGKVLFNLKDITKYDLTNIVSYTSQDENIFNDTILNNLLLGEKINEELLDDIIQICRIDDINAVRECGLDFMLINSNSLSGGEKNRLILARSLLHSKKIIILDEVLKEIDYELECLIVKDMLKYFKDRIILYVSHKDVGNLFDNVLTFRKE